MAATTLLVLALSAAPASALPFLQYGVDAARTGATADPGPASLDLAFNTTRAEPQRDAVPWGALPVLLDGTAYALQGINPIDIVDDTDIGEDGPLLGELGPAFIERIDLATTERTIFANLGDRVVTSSLLSDGERLFVTVNDEVRAFDLGSGEPAWSEPYMFPALTATAPKEVLCHAGAVADGVVYLPCQQASDAGPLALRRYAASRAIVVALDAATGAERWRWTPEPHTVEQDEDGGVSLRAQSYAAIALVVGEGRVFVALRGLPSTVVSAPGRPHGAGSIFGLDAATGDVLWRRPFEGVVTTELLPTASGPVRTVSSTGARVRLLYAPGVLYAKQTYLVALDPATGANQWELRLVPQEDAADTTGNALAMHADRLFTTAFSTLYAIDVRTHAIAWQSRLPEGESWAEVDSVIVAGGRVYAIAVSGRIYSFDVDDGTIVEQREIPGTDSRFAVGEGVLAALGGDGRVLVLGSTPAAIAPQLGLSDVYPAPGTQVLLDLSRTRPGVLSDTFEARIDWGDGVLTPWSQELVHTHAYTTAGERTINVRMRNPAGQEASASLVVHVGATPPRDLNLVQKAFDRDNQDLTFGVLGVAIALGGGLVAVSRQRTRRRRVQRELDAIERAYADTREHPLTCEAALAERLAHVRGLGLDGKLDQAEVLLLERRIVELRQALRLESIDEQFGFLTVNMARSLREMLADGRITSWERDHFLAALDEDAHLTRAQKRNVKAQIEAWFARDEGGTV